MRAGKLCLLGLVTLLGGPASAAPPIITAMTPRGAERGKASIITFTGANLTGKAQAIFPFAVTQKVRPDAKPNVGQVRLEITLPAMLPLGIYPVRLLTEDGLSGLAFFGVDVFPSILETEDNSSFEKAQKVSFPSVITGQCGGGDVDFYRFHVGKGQRVVVETEAARMASGVLPQIRVTDGDRRLVAADDSQRLRGDCRVSFVAPAEGDYVVEFSDSRYRGAAPPHYRLKIADYDFAEEVFPLGGKQGENVEFTLRGGNLDRDVRLSRLLGPPSSQTLNPSLRLLDLGGALKPGMLAPEIAVGTYREQSGGSDAKGPRIAPPVTINGRIETRGEIDRYRFPVQAGQRYRFSVEAESLGSYLDGVLRVTDQTGKLLARVDDIDIPASIPGQQPIKTADPSLDLTVPAGVTELHVEVRDGLGRGGINHGYRLTVEPACEDFTLELLVSELNIPVSGFALVPVAVKRRGYNGPIQLGAANLPSGVSLQGGYIPDGSVGGVMTLTSTPAAMASAPANLTIEGRGMGAGKDLVVRAQHRIVLSRDGNVAASSFHLAHLAVGRTAEAPFSVSGPAAIELVAGYPTSVPVKLARGMKSVAVAIEVAAIASVPGAPPPPGLTLKPASAAAGADEAAFTISTTPQLRPGRHGDLAVQGKAKINNKDESVIGPAIMLTVVQPFAVALMPREVTLKPGQSAAIKGRLQRRPIFREPVQLKLDALPKGVTLAAPLMPIAPAEADFQIVLRADAKAAAVTAKLSLTCSTSIAGTVYAQPALVVPLHVRP